MLSHEKTITRTACEAGSASADGVACNGCAAGEYQASAAQASCLPCVKGNYCPPSSSDPIACAPASFANVHINFKATRNKTHWDASCHCELRREKRETI